jgi:hypothetical protein
LSGVQTGLSGSAKLPDYSASKGAVHALIASGSVTAFPPFVVDVLAMIST